MPILRFGAFEVDTDSGELRKRGFRLRLREQSLRVLLTLVDYAGQVVTREQLRHRLWPDGTFVDFDRAINKAVSELRGVLGDSACSPRFVETLSNRGYRFIGPVDVSHSAFARQPDGFHSDGQLAYVTGRYLWNRRTVTDLYSSIGCFEQALAVENGSALAHAGLADANVILGIWGVQPSDIAFGVARRAAARALELNPNLAEAHTSLAEVLKDYEWNWSLAERHYQHALSLRPGYATAHQWYAQLGRAYLFSNHMERAVQTLECALTLAGPASMWEAELSYARARAGDHPGALRLLSGLTERARREYVSPYDLAIAFTGIGDHDSALDYLEEAFAQRVMRIVGLGDPEFDGLRAEPRYRHLLDRLRLPSAPM